MRGWLCPSQEVQMFWAPPRLHEIQLWLVFLLSEAFKGKIWYSSGAAKRLSGTLTMAGPGKPWPAHCNPWSFVLNTTPASNKHTHPKRLKIPEGRLKIPGGQLKIPGEAAQDP